jgi:hypothetical protein
VFAVLPLDVRYHRLDAVASFRGTLTHASVYPLLHGRAN